MAHDAESRERQTTLPRDAATDERGYQPEAGPRPDFTQLKPPRSGSAIQRPQTPSPPQDR